MNDRDVPLETFPALDIPVCRHAFITRIPGIDVSQDKADALKRLESAHLEIRSKIGLASLPLLTAEQIHGDKIVVVGRPLFESPGSMDSFMSHMQHKTVQGNSAINYAGCDGLIANQRGVLLGVHVADCCAVYIVDPKTPAIGLVHSGKKGTELAIAKKTIEQMKKKFGSDPANMIVQLSPCIRPPHYEIDFAAEIVRQCRSSGVKEVHDTGICTACDLDRYYSYRAEKGKTGRMLALLGLT